MKNGIIAMAFLISMVPQILRGHTIFNAANILSGTLDPARQDHSSNTMVGPLPSFGVMQGDGLRSSHTVEGLGLPLTFNNEGTSIGGITKSIDCVGAGIGCTQSGASVTVTVTGGGSGFLTESDWNVMNTTGMSRVDELQADLSTHSTRVDELQADLSTHSVRVDELQIDLSTHSIRIDQLQVHVSTAQVLIFDLSNATANIKNTTNTYTAAQNFSSATFGGLVVFTTSVHILGNLSSTGTFSAKGSSFTTVAIDLGASIVDQPSLAFGPFVNKDGIGRQSGANGITIWGNGENIANFDGTNDLITFGKNATFSGLGNGPSTMKLSISNLDPEYGLYTDYDITTLENWGFSSLNRPLIMINELQRSAISIGAMRATASLSISTIQSNSPIFNVSSGSVLFEINGSSIFAPSMIVIDGSATIRGIVVSSAGFQVAASTVQGAFMVEGGSIQVRNGENEFTLTFATRPVAGEKLLVASVVGNRALIASGVDAVGGSGSGDFNSLQNPATGFFSMNTFGIGFASQVAGGQLLFDGSSTVRGINISSTGFMVGASTVQGVFLLEGGTFQFRNGSNEFSITFATLPIAGQKLVVANVTGNRALIASSIDQAGGAGASPITADDWNVMNSTQMRLQNASTWPYICEIAEAAKWIGRPKQFGAGNLNNLAISTNMAGSRVDRDAMITLDGMPFASSTRQFAGYQTSFSSFDWVENSTISWDYSVFMTSSAATGGQVRFCLQAFSINKGTDVSASIYTSSVCVNIPDIVTNMAVYLSTPSAEMSISPTNYVFGDNPIAFRVFRDPIDGADNLAGVAYMVGLHINRRWKPPDRTGGP